MPSSLEVAEIIKALKRHGPASTGEGKDHPLEWLEKKVNEALAIRESINVNASVRSRIVKKYEAEMADNDKETAKIQKRCDHLWKNYRDPAGGSDSFNECIVCGMIEDRSSSAGYTG